MVVIARAFLTGVVSKGSVFWWWKNELLGLGDLYFIYEGSDFGFVLIFGLFRELGLSWKGGIELLESMEG